MVFLKAGARLTRRAPVLPFRFRTFYGTRTPFANPLEPGSFEIEIKKRFNRNCI
ncbi:MAG: hypothetical protein K0Q43_179 [Ramlibacter sp.]|jgi:hypothetical protein|nr:hypothetical protein [Ramlibacter sp.]